MAPSNRTDGPGVYVALGDSISIDRYAGGEGRGGASLLTRNRDDDFPQWRGRDLATLSTLSYHLLATDGGTTSTLLDAQLLRLEGSALAPHDRLTVGGNDLLGAYGDTRRAREVVSVVRRRVGQALVRVRSAMRQRSDPVIVGAVYDPSDGTGDASRVGLPPWPQVVDILAELNVALHGVAAEHGAQVADIHGHFLGHGLRAGNPAQSDPRPADRNLWFCNVIEPKPGEPARCARHSGTPCTEPGEAQYRSPHPSPQRAQRPDRAQGADEGNWQATTAPAGGNL